MQNVLDWIAPMAAVLRVSWGISFSVAAKLAGNASTRNSSDGRPQPLDRGKDRGATTTTAPGRCTAAKHLASRFRTSLHPRLPVERSLKHSQARRERLIGDPALVPTSRVA